MSTAARVRAGRSTRRVTASTAAALHTSQAGQLPEGAPVPSWQGTGAASQHAAHQAMVTWVTAPADAPAAAGLRPHTPEPPALPTRERAKKAPPLSSISTGVVAAATCRRPGQSAALPARPCAAACASCAAGGCELCLRTSQSCSSTAADNHSGCLPVSVQPSPASQSTGKRSARPASVRWSRSQWRWTRLPAHPADTGRVTS